MIVEVGAIHLVLNCLSIFTHHNSNIAPGPEIIKPTVKTPAVAVTEEQVTSDDKSHVYWAKGTGFGTGSTQQSWNVEQALLRQKSEEEHVTVLLQVKKTNIFHAVLLITSSIHRFFQATSIPVILCRQLKLVMGTASVIASLESFVFCLRYSWIFCSSHASFQLCARTFVTILVRFICTILRF